MKKIHGVIFLVIISLCIAGCKPKSDNSGGKTEYKLGMLLESDNRLAGIPLASTPAGGVELPPSFDLSASLPPVGHQGQQQSCVAWAVAYALKSYQEKVEIGQQLLFSPSFIYNQINNGQNVPTYVTDALNVLSQQGVCNLEEMPYNDNDWVSKPSTTARDNAKKYRIDFWRRVNIMDIKEVKAQIASGYPVIIGAQVSNEFIEDGRKEKANYIWKTPGTSAGGHAMLVVGYDDTKNAFKLMNSWGTDWGDNGFGWLDYENWPKVVMYGFVAKDATTENAIVNNQQNNPQNIDTTLTTKNPEEHVINEDDMYIDPTEFTKLDFKCTDVKHNVTVPEEPNLNYVMKLEGVLKIPPGQGKVFQVVVHFYDANTKRQVGSLMVPRFADVNGFAAAFTQQYSIPENGWDGTWLVQLPYDAVNVPAGKSLLYGVPTLFIDNFGVSYGERVNFYLTK